MKPIIGLAGATCFFQPAAPQTKAERIEHAEEVRSQHRKADWAGHGALGEIHCLTKRNERNVVSNCRKKKMSHDITPKNKQTKKVVMMMTMTMTMMIYFGVCKNQTSKSHPLKHPSDSNMFFPGRFPGFSRVFCLWPWWLSFLGPKKLQVKNRSL